MTDVSDSEVDRLVRAGARLMAERCWESVDLADVAEEAGSADAGAVAYHFGSREGLLMEIVSRSIEAMEERRRQDLQRLTPESGVEAVVSAIVEPLTDLLLLPEHRDFLRLNSQLALFVDNAGTTLAGPVVGTALGREWGLLREVLSARLGPETAHRRVRWMMLMVLVTCGSRGAEVTRWVGASGSLEEMDAAAAAHGEPSHEAFTTATVRLLTAAITA